MMKKQVGMLKPVARLQCEGWGCCSIRTMKNDVMQRHQPASLQSSKHLTNKDNTIFIMRTLVLCIVYCVLCMLYFHVKMKHAAEIYVLIPKLACLFIYPCTFKQFILCRDEEREHTTMFMLQTATDVFIQYKYVEER